MRLSLLNWLERQILEMLTKTYFVIFLIASEVIKI